ncbi:MAG: CdaR family protein [Acidaminococcaceae bacterium]|jgi:YbbR domain-containing protein|nr:CdaR family protein [Acidaminococcaceae bacterium]
MRNYVTENNWLPRILCVVLACCLWLYVMNEQNPIIERSFVVNLETRGLQSGMLVFNAPTKVNVKVRSSRSILGDINPETITAYLNLENMKVGQHAVTVACDFPKGEVLEISPKVVNLYIDVSKEKTLPVTTRIVGIPAADLTVGRRVVTPTEVKVKGAAHRVDAVERVIAPLDITERKDDFTAHINLVAVGTDGIEMPDLVVEPAVAAVEAKMVHQLVTTDVSVKANLTGTLPAGLKLAKVELVPAQLKVTAPPSTLEKTTAIATAPVDLSKVNGNMAVKVALELPEGFVSDTHNVEVRLSVEKE